MLIDQFFPIVGTDENITFINMSHIEQVVLSFEIERRI